MTIQPAPQIGLELFVPGIPKPQGSKRHVGHGVMLESSKDLGPWRERIALACHNTMTDARLPMLAGAQTISLRFVLPRPKATPKSYTPLATRRTDLDKLARAVLDAITHVLIVDDSLITTLHASKRLAEPGETPGVLIQIDPAIDERRPQ
jgi:crossover junction endodeoxyribonuclease RusA